MKAAKLATFLMKSAINEDRYLFLFLEMILSEGRISPSVVEVSVMIFFFFTFFMEIKFAEN